jgi:hypothetical protein
MVDEIARLPKAMAVEIVGGGVLSTGGVQAAADGWSEGV